MVFSWFNNLSETFTRYRHYAGEVEDIIIDIDGLVVVSSLCQQLVHVVAVR